MELAEAILQNLDEAVCLFNQQGELVFVNRAAEEFFGRNSTELRGAEIGDLFTQPPDLAVFLGNTLAEGRPYNGKDIHLEAGRSVTVDLAIVPYYAEAKLEGALFCIREHLDITEREDFQFDSLLYLLGAIAHEVKNPLSGIKGAAQILKKTTPGGEAAEAVRLILKETDRLNAVVQSYLTITRKPAFHPVNIHEIVEHALHVMQPAIREHAVTIRKSYDPSLPIIAGDESKLLQVLINLLKNAAESVSLMKGERVISISTRPSHEYALIHEPSGRARSMRKQRWAVIAIQDTGAGITREEIPRIFLPYYTRKTGGSGLGLALSKKIIRDHDGIIKVKSALGSGTTFSVYLPFQTGPPPTSGKKR